MTKQERKSNGRTEEGVSTFPCAICGGGFLPDRLSRCEACGVFCCRDCLKVAYQQLTDEDYRPTRVLCYYCYHSMEKK